jgi:hypothetical protein
MGRTLPSSTQVFLQEEQAFARFRRALRRADQTALDDLFMSARQHLAAAQYAAHALPFEVFLLSMLLEEHKKVMKLCQQVEALEAKCGIGQVRNLPLPIIDEGARPLGGDSYPAGTVSPPPVAQNDNF